ncbi:MAG: hypothetical protein JJT75_01665, partial [Opitutales bacterium]|nr:hypothetical protein [Opitutales bacterium]
MSDCGPKKTILVEIPNEHSIGVPVFRGVQEWLKPRVSWEFVGPQMGTYRHDWYEDPKQMMREVDAALVFGFFPWKKMIEVEELNGRLFLAGHKKELSMWWQVGAVDEDVGRLAASYLKKTGMSNYGFVGYETPSFNRARLRGFGEGLGLAQSDLWVIEHQNFIYSTAEGHTITMLDKHGEWINQLKDWMAGLPPRTALFCANDILGKDVV